MRVFGENQIWIMEIMTLYSDKIGDTRISNYTIPINMHIVFGLLYYGIEIEHYYVIFHKYSNSPVTVKIVHN